LKTLTINIGNEKRLNSTHELKVGTSGRAMSVKIVSVSNSSIYCEQVGVTSSTSYANFSCEIDLGTLSGSQDFNLQLKRDTAAPNTVYNKIWQLFLQLPTLSNPKINAMEVFAGDAINHTIDIEGASGYIFSWNGTDGCSGTWSNSSWTSVSSKTTTGWNVSIPTSNCAGKTIAWKFYANNSQGWSVSDEQTYQVYKYGWLNVTWAVGSEINSITCTASSPCQFTQYSTFNVNATVECEGGTGAKCGSVSGSARYNESSANPDKLINTTKGATPFFISDSYDFNYSWNNVIPTQSPPGRQGHMMSYDKKFDVTILFGGYVTDDTNETWIYNYSSKSLT